MWTSLVRLCMLCCVTAFLWGGGSARSNDIYWLVNDTVQWWLVWNKCFECFCFGSAFAAPCKKNTDYENVFCFLLVIKDQGFNFLFQTKDSCVKAAILSALCCLRWLVFYFNRTTLNVFFVRVCVVKWYRYKGASAAVLKNPNKNVNFLI